MAITLSTVSKPPLLYVLCECTDTAGRIHKHIHRIVVTPLP